jgi:hypothetical protein
MEDGMRHILRKLEGRGTWRKRQLLRQKAYSIVNHRCALMYAHAGDYRAALWRSLRALMDYPLPYRRDEVATPLERSKWLIRNLLAALGLNGVTDGKTLPT